MATYSPARIEKKWQKYWAAKKIYATKDFVAGKKNKMVLVEFPYPSGNLHIGHWYAFALPDMYARYWRMRGYNVLYPIGFDAFGLPAENAAIKHGTSPDKWTNANIKYMTKQLQNMGAAFDWSRKISTIDPEYYKWTQWMFLRMLEKGLAYRAKTLVNWCPNDKTVLANEQVVDGHCERCGASVEQRSLEQWMLRTTAYADRLLDESGELDWPHTTRIAQQNWIGRSDGALVKFQVESQKSKEYINVFTTRADTLYGCTYVVLAPEHPLVAELTTDEHREKVKAYQKEVIKKSELDRAFSEKEKTGVPTGAYAINPANGERVPVWIADYVLGSYGTGAIMAVPAHDQRDFEFAKKFNLAIKQVIHPADGSHHSALSAYELPGILTNSGPYSGKTSKEAADAIARKLHDLGMGGPQRTYKLRDWVLSRQRYWGVPIPVIRCPACGYVAVPDKDLPVKLPQLDDFKPADAGCSPLAKAERWLRVKCPKCGEQAERETDTMDTFVDSSWYYIRYTDPKNAKKFADEKKMQKWLPVAMYVGGAEHNTMHLLYSRFFAKALYDLGQISFSEPFLARRNHGVILGSDGQKMSKSRGNVVDPDKEVAYYGADTVRMYLAFMAPYEQGGPWDPKGINGVMRFLKRVWNLCHAKGHPLHGDEMVERALHEATKKIGEDLESLALNTCVSELMKLLNTIEGAGGLTFAQRERFLLLLAPFAPHIAEELWMNVLKKKRSVHCASWPEYDASLLVRHTVTMPIQVNGKVRGVLSVPIDIRQDDAVFAAKQDEKIARHLASGEIKKIIFIPGKLLNFVVS